MYRNIDRLIVFKNIAEDSILIKLSEIIRKFDNIHNYTKLDGGLNSYNDSGMISEIYSVIHSLLDISTKYGFDGNLWHNYISYILATTENPFTIVSEKNKALNGSVNRFVLNDLANFKSIFDYDFSKLENYFKIDCFSIISDYKAVVKSEQIYNKSVSKSVRYLSAEIEKTSTAEEMYEVVTNFYHEFGVGKLGLNKAFRVVDDVENGKSVLSPITCTDDILLSNLVGYELQKEKLIQNTEAFINRKPANNCLLYGDAGTGKSSSVKALLNEYYDDGLRMIEVYKHQFKSLSSIISEIKNRNYRFIIFMDDLSFEEFEIEYKYLKAVIEGGLENKPENVLIYATSNRRHLIKEMWSDRTDMSEDELHRSDTVQEKLSLAARFGVSIGYFKPSQKEYYEIVTGIASRYPEIKLSEEELLKEAHKWEIYHGGMSGRVARQFVDYIISKNA
ncbi:MAG: ATP-binding protein [Lachnospiraceae bacterium]|nr:ATP-binding protein [Lachnospiraceae bacterium]